MSEEFMPYGPWRRWVRAVRAHHRRRRSDDDGTDRTYLAYGFGLLALVYGPILWSAVAQAGIPLGAGGPIEVRSALVEAGAAIFGAACLAGVFVARLGTPVWITTTDAAYALGGVWDPRTVLWRRIGVLVVGVAAAAALVGSALVAGAFDAAGRTEGPGAVLAWAACAAGLALGPLALAVAAQCPRWRATARVAAVLVAVLVAVIGGFVAVAGAGLVDGVVPAIAWCADPPVCDVMGGPEPILPSTPPGVVVGGSVALTVVGLWLLFAVLPRDLDADAVAGAWRRTVVTGTALGAGDATGVRSVAGPVRLRGRRASFPRVLLRHAPLAARDLLGVRRRAGGMAASLVAGVVGVVLVAMSAAGAPGALLAAVAGGLVLYGASAVWTGGLQDMAEQAVPGGLLPGGPLRAALAHLPVPVLLAGLVGVLGLLTARLVVPAVADAGGDVVAVAVVALLTVLSARVWVAGANQAPPELFTPMSGPAGDMSVVVVVSWFLRGWLVIAGVLWVLARSGPVLLPLVGVMVLWLAISGVRRIGRL